ncbi:MAG: M42 family metallopeptidase [Chloroflexi bacterium]|nr:M42 family metallopeptidase [Chloroflexota bacterium]MDA1241465.1 M42 family metallopeptidase [Chloroflexota bacterium]
MTQPSDLYEADLELLERLSNVHGPTGFEGPVRAIVREELEPVVHGLETDGVGSLIARLDGASERPRIMFAAHMDELGALVRRITAEGYLKFQPLGGWLDQALINQRWVVLTRNGPVPGLTGIKTVHVMSSEDRGKVFKRDDMFIDVGATSREDAETRLSIRPGDPVAPDSRYQPMAGGDLLMGKAWDDRVGVGVMVQALRALRAEGHPNTVFGVATVQEEVGLRGAQTSAWAVEPDIGICIESGVAGDYPGISEDEAQEKLGGGPGIFLHDSSMLPNNRLRDLVIETAEAVRVPLQFNVLSGYGQDGAAIQKTRAGVPSINITVPNRYLHSHTGVIHRGDVGGAVRLITELVRRLDGPTVERLKAFD